MKNEYTNVILKKHPHSLPSGDIDMRVVSYEITTLKELSPEFEKDLLVLIHKYTK